MIVGTTSLDYKELKMFVDKPEELVCYVDNLVPMWAKHIKGIVYNQRYYVAVHLRNVLTIPYKSRMAMVDALIKDVTLTGIMSDFTSIIDIVESCNKESLLHMIEEEINYAN